MNYIALKTSMVVIMLAATVTACSKEEADQHVVVDFDVSRSAMSQGSSLDGAARGVIASEIEAMTAGDRLTVVGFNFEPGSACEPLVFTIAADANSEEVRRQRTLNSGGQSAAIDRYISCLTGSDNGFEGIGSAIFGSIPTALNKARHSEFPVSQVIVVTDGCSVGEGVPTCKPETLALADAAQVMDALPAELKPDMSGIGLSFVGIGQGAQLQAAEIERLRRVFDAYAATTNARTNQ